MTRRVALLLALLFVPFSEVQAGQQGQPCTAAGALVKLPGLPEASGLALSRRVPGRLWTHNDSGQPVLFALDSRGAVVGQLRISGAKVEDWEALAVGPCGSGSCIYIGDIGDNDAKRRRITVYRVAEPETAGVSAAAAEAFHATYPDGAHDAETLFVAGGRLYIVTKGETGPVGIYRFPSELKAGSVMKLERVGGATTLKADDTSLITDGSVSPDGRWIVLRSRAGLTFYRAADLLSGQWRAASTVDLRGLKEPQGEGVALGADNVVLLAGEGGGKRNPGTFVRFDCALPGN